MNEGKHKKWNKERIKKESYKIAAAMGYFPSASDLREIKRNDLACAIERTGGYISWAKQVGFPRKISASDIGWEGEKQVQGLLTAHNFNVEVRDHVKCPFDLTVDHVLRVDVKSAKYCRYGYSSGWFYRLGKTPQADLILLWQMDCRSFYALPWYVCPTTNVTITQTGTKYKMFKDSYDVIHKMVERRKQEVIEIGIQTYIA